MPDQLTFDDIPEEEPRRRRDQILERFVAFHSENPQVWELFRRFTFDVLRRGFTHYSANAIFQRIRWHVDIETTGSELKLNDHYHTWYARMFIAKNPDHTGFFELRKLTSADRPAYKTDMEVPPILPPETKRT